MLHEFDIEIRDKKGFENMVAGHLSRLIVDFNEDVTPIAEMFPDEQLMHISQIPAPWFVDIVNYLVIAQNPHSGPSKTNQNSWLGQNSSFGMIHTCLNTSYIKL